MRRFFFITLCILMFIGYSNLLAGDVDFSWGQAKLKKVTAAAKAEIEAKDKYQDMTITFVEEAGNSDFATITKLPWVKKLKVNNTQITDISPVAKLKKLEEFSATSMDAAEDAGGLDISPLGSCPELQEANFYGTEVKGQNALVTCTKMKDLSFYMSDVTDISCVASMPDLEELDLYACDKIMSYQPMKGLKKLRDLNLYMHKAPLTEFNVLLTLPALEEIWLHFTKITNLNFMKNCVNMKDLDASWCRELADISGVAGMKKLEVLELDDAPVTDISPVKNLTNLKRLVLEGTKVTDISPIKGLQKLERLELSETKISDISVLTHLPILEDLYLDETLVTDIGLLKNVKTLERLDLSKTKVTDITPLMKLPKLNSLELPLTVPAAQIDKFKQANPDCKVKIDKK